MGTNFYGGREIKEYIFMKFLFIYLLFFVLFFTSLFLSRGNYYKKVLISIATKYFDWHREKRTYAGARSEKILFG